jgi:hypothetical protein
MKFQRLAGYFSKLEETSSRLKITEILASLLSETSLEEVDKICYLSLGQLAPLYAGVEFNLAEKLMRLKFWPRLLDKKKKKFARNLRKQEIWERLLTI